MGSPPNYPIPRDIGAGDQVTLEWSDNPASVVGIVVAILALLLWWTAESGGPEPDVPYEPTDEHECSCETVYILYEPEDEEDDESS